MPSQHPPIPDLPARPRVHPIASHIYRSYPVGRQSFSRACQGELLEITISTEDPLPDGVQACLVTASDSNGDSAWADAPFDRADARTLICRVAPKRPGLHSFRAQFSLDGGATWLRDTVPDAWVLVDPPQVDALRLYTMIPTVSGTVSDWKADLKRIRSLGFNAVHLLPITTLDTSQSPYAARDLFAIDAGYLTESRSHDGLTELEEFIAEARALGIRLCFDLVLNHVGVESAIARRAPDWIVPDQHQPDGFHRARYWSNQAWHNWDDLVLIDYEHPSEAIRAEIWTYMTEYALFWAKYANDTGGFVRFDNLHGSDPDFIMSVTRALRGRYPRLGLLAEYFTDENTLLHTGLQWGINLIMATPWDYKFVPQLREYLIYIHRVSEHVRYFMPMTSHDSGAPAQEFGNTESTIPRYVAAALLGTGATGITQGVEYAEMERISFIGRKPKMQFPAEPMFGPFITLVNSILVDNPVFRHGDNCRFVDNGHHAVIAAFREDLSAELFGFLVVCNFDISGPQHISVDLTPFLGHDGPFPCSDLLTGEMQTFPLPVLDLELPSCSAKVLRFDK